MHKNGLSMLSKATNEHSDILGHLMVTVAKVAKEQGLNEGYRVVINNGKHGC